MSLIDQILALVQVIGSDIKNLQNSIAKPVYTIEIDLGYPSKTSGVFLITGLSGLTVNKQVVISQAAGSYTGKGDDEMEMDCVLCAGNIIDSSTIEVSYNSRFRVGGNFKFNYIIQ